MAEPSREAAIQIALDLIASGCDDNEIMEHLVVGDEDCGGSRSPVSMECAKRYVGAARRRIRISTAPDDLLKKHLAIRNEILQAALYAEKPQLDTALRAADSLADMEGVRHNMFVDVAANGVPVLRFEVIDKQSGGKARPASEGDNKEQ